MFPQTKERITRAALGGVGFAVEFATLGEYAPFSDPPAPDGPQLAVEPQQEFSWEWPGRESCHRVLREGRHGRDARPSSRVRPGAPAPHAARQPCLAD